MTLPPGNGRVLTNREGYFKRYWNIDVVATKRLTNKWMFRGFVTWQQHREYSDDPARAIQDPTPRLEGAPFASASGLVDGGIAVNAGEFAIHGTWLYSVAGLYELPWEMSVAGTMYGRQGNPVAEVLTIERPGGLGPTRVFLDRNLEASRFPDVQLLDARVQKQFALGRVRATLNVDVFNVLNTGSTLRQFTDARHGDVRRAARGRGAPSGPAGSSTSVLRRRVSQRAIRLATSTTIAASALRDRTNASLLAPACQDRASMNPGTWTHIPELLRLRFV